MARADESPGRRVRDLVRQIPRAGLATLLAGEPAPWPYASLVLVALDHDASPLLLLSDLADHTKNLRTDPRAALLFDGTEGWRNPLAGPRAALLGRVRPCDDARLAARFLARHPDAAAYAGFADFHLYRMALERAHLVAGFGEIHWLDAAAVLFDTADSAALAVAEPEIVDHMNADHADAVKAIANERSATAAEAWTMTGIDPEGADFRSGQLLARAAFQAPVHTAAAARRELVRLTRAARTTGS